jgi:hypothetical protein
MQDKLSKFCSKTYLEQNHSPSSSTHGRSYSLNALGNFNKASMLMYKVNLFHYKNQFNADFNVNPGNQGSPIIFLLKYYIFKNTKSNIYLLAVSLPKSV